MRLDHFLVLKSLARSRTQAAELIKEGRVEVKLLGEGFRSVLKPSFSCGEDTEVRLKKDSNAHWVSRAAGKLDFAIEFLGLNLEGFKVLDIGQSTGGFTQICLDRGASHIVGVDVGKDQLALELKSDPRIEFYESCDARDLDFLKDRDFNLVVMDVSFISSLKVLKSLKDSLKNNLSLLVLVKPQFEVGKSKVGKGGLVEKSEVHLLCQREYLKGLQSLGFEVLNYFPSMVKGRDGNQEFFCYFSN